MILVDGVELNYVKFPDGTTGLRREDKNNQFITAEWIYQGDLAEAFVCLQLLRNNKVGAFVFTFLPFARQDGPVHIVNSSNNDHNEFSDLFAFLDIFKEFKATQFMVRDCHSARVLPDGWINIQTNWIDDLNKFDKEDTLIVFPDGSAWGRFGYKNFNDLEYISFCKDRDDKGNIIGMHTAHPYKLILESNDWKNILVFDDICDGGATFIELAKHLPKVNLHLFTTYGIYSKGLQVIYDAGYTSITCKFVIPWVEHVIENCPVDLKAPYEAPKE